MPPHTIKKESVENRAEIDIEAIKKKRVRVKKIIDWVIRGCIYLLVFLVPLFFIPNVPSVLELNKQLLIVTVGGIAFLTWVGKLAWEGEIRLKKNPLIVPIAFLLVIFSLSTIFSHYRDQSMWGGFGTEGFSLVTYIALIAIFLVINNNFSGKKITYLLLALIFSTFFVSLFALLQIFGKFIFKNPLIAQSSFNTIGSVFSLSVYLGAILILTVAMLLEKRALVIKISLGICSALFLFILIMINFSTALISFLVGIAIFLGLAIVTSGGSKEKNRALIFPMIILTLALVATLIGRTKPIIPASLPVEVSLSQTASYEIAKGAWKDNFLLGVGPSNYALAYLKNKPVEINLSNFWGVAFNEAGSRFFTIAASVGFLGTAAFLFLIGSMAFYIFVSFLKIFGKSESGTYTLIGIAAGWIYLTVIFFLYPSNITSDLVWWLLMAIFIALASDVFKKKEEIISQSSSPRASLMLSFGFVLIIVGFISLIYLEGQKYVAAAAYNKALTSDVQGGEAEELVNKLSRVTSLDRSRDIYSRNLSVALFVLLNEQVKEKGLENLSEDDRANISNLFLASEESAKTAIKISPKNADNYVQLAQINQNVIGSKDDAEQIARDNYLEALKYDPKNPALYYQIGQVYLTMADLETAKSASQQTTQRNQQVQLPEKAKEYIASAKQNFEKAVELKSNYIQAQFMIAVVLEKLGEIDQAIAKLQESKSINPRDAGILFQLGILYYKNEQYNQARGELEAAVKFQENYSNARYFLGLVYDKLDEKEKALEQFRRIAELNPDNEDVKKVISNLEEGKEALDGFKENTIEGQETQQPEQAPESIQREQEPVPPETPIESPGENEEEENPEGNPHGENPRE